MSATQPQPSRSRTRFNVRIDRHGAVLIDCHAGSDHAETGVRGLAGLVQRGWMSQPRELHVDPLLEHVDIDGTRYKCDEAGVRQLEQDLNAHYSRPFQENADRIHVRENAGSPTGFDIEYVTVRHTVRHEITGHLGTEELDRLQDPTRCDLIRPDTVIRMHPPHLIVRRRLPDGSEVPIPGLPDLEYWGVNASAVQRMLNHPDVARWASAAASPDVAASAVNPPAPATLPLPPDPAPRRNPEMAPLHLARRETPPSNAPTAPGPPPPPALPAEILALFPERPPNEIQRGIFEALCEDVDFPADEVELEIPGACEGRRFRVLNFDHTSVEGIMDLRGEEFRGFYLTELRKHGADLVYACRGVHIEWCADECVLQPGLRAEPVEFDGPALLGLAQDANSDFVFLVKPAYLAWIKPHLALCEQANARFASLADYAQRRAELTLIWPLSGG